MGIIFEEKERQFHLFNPLISYCIEVCPDGEIGQLYFGKRINENQTVAYHQTKGVRPLCCNLEEDENYTKELGMLEYPAFGNGDFRTPAYEVLQENGSRVTNLIYKSHKIYKGKKKIEGLPTTYTNSEEEAQTLEILCEDKVAGIEVSLFYTIWEDYPILCRHASIKNVSANVVILNKALSFCIDLPDNDYSWLEFEGAWGRERNPFERNLSHGSTLIESARGHSSANFNPFVIVKRENTDEFAGEAFSLSFVYSGNFVIQSEADTFGRLRLLAGINPRWFQWKLEKGQEFETPEVIVTYTDQGLNDLSHNLHHFLNNNLVRSPYKNKPRPILLNNWEATEMDFTEDKILQIAGKGKEAGVELFVLDDGWFGKRNNDYAGLGDWKPNLEKLPGGIKGLSEKIHDMGLMFGLWIEPEMANPDSDMFRQHPDWVLGAPDRPRTLGRHQMVLDFSKKEVVDNIYSQLYEVFSNSKIDYIKWDMNRSITECYSQGLDCELQGMRYHKYILGVYDLYERLIKTFPNILFESCASGGARFDCGMLYYAPQAWCSDDTDGHERVKIQYGTSYGYPIAAIGAHVSASPNLQTGRDMTIGDRANIAYFGTFGYELDLNEISEEDFEEVRRQIIFMKEYRELFQYGDLYRLSSPFEKNIASWMVVSKDKKTAIMAAYKNLNTPNEGMHRVRLKGLERSYLYSINDADEMYGDLLMGGGLPLNGKGAWYFSDKDFSSRLYVLKAKVTK